MKKRRSEHLNGTVKRRKVATDDGTPVYDLVNEGKVIARAAMTGRAGVDHYPWDWHMTKTGAGGGCADSLRSVVQQVETIVASGGAK